MTKLRQKWREEMKEVKAELDRQLHQEMLEQQPPVQDKYPGIVIENEHTLRVNFKRPGGEWPTIGDIMQAIDHIELPDEERNKVHFRMDRVSRTAQDDGYYFLEMRWRTDG